MEHLACFYPGVLNLYAMLVGQGTLDRVCFFFFFFPNPLESSLLCSFYTSYSLAPGGNLELGTSLTATCASAYFHSPSGLAPNAITFGDREREETPEERFHHLKTDDEMESTEEEETIEEEEDVSDDAEDIAPADRHSVQPLHAEEWIRSPLHRKMIRDLISSSGRRHGSTDPDEGRRIWEVLDGVMGSSSDAVFHASQRHFLQRPETVESILIQYRKTGDPIFR